MIIEETLTRPAVLSREAVRDQVLNDLQTQLQNAVDQNKLLQDTLSKVMAKPEVAT